MVTEVKTKLNKHTERTIVQDSLKDKLSKLKDQANAALQGIAAVTKSDIVNLLLDEYSETLSATAIAKLKAQHLDQVKYAFWMAKRLKQAQAAGENLTIQDVLAMSEPVMSQPIAKKLRRPRKKKEQPKEELPPKMHE